ncbi:MAG: hypothetical protein E6Q97_12765 [Desulfurellales bacterium]|nr:MAG: hypothetical protein E6Q97_12765 [Desulfurellales bacterium]
MNNNHYENANEFLLSGKLQATPERGIHCPARVVATIGCTDVTFEYGSDFKWRMTYVSTYGNGSFVNGEGCDASGYVITDIDLMERLDGQF